MISTLSGKLPPALLALSNGTFFSGFSIGASGKTTGELVFNTSMTGYQEIISDPSYCQQIITFTYPHIGNVGCNLQDQEALSPSAAGLVVREYAHFYSNWRATESLSEYLQKHQIVAIAGIDTRALTHILRSQGAQSAAIVTNCEDPRQAILLARSFEGIENTDLTSQVSTVSKHSWNTTSLQPQFTSSRQITPKPHRHIVVYDLGIKHNILRLLADRGCQITVVPAATQAADAIKLRPDGILFSNGPGDPAACSDIIKNIQQLSQQPIPLFGICLGCQLLALAMGAHTFKMKHGHHGANHPVQDITNKQVYITSQNHGFAIDDSRLPLELEITHRSLFDNTIQGFKHKHKPILAFQGHPEANPGPQDIEILFDQFIKLIPPTAKTSCQKEPT